MKQFSNLICFEFSKYSSCFQAVNDLSDSNTISVFELSPTPSGGILILNSENHDQIEKFYFEQIKKLTSTILNSCCIPKLNPEIISTYLSQNKPTTINSLSFFETNSLCEGFLMAQKMLNSECGLVDFRVIRSIHNRVVIVFNGLANETNCVQIANPTIQTTDYFQIQK